MTNFVKEIEIDIPGFTLILIISKDIKYVDKIIEKFVNNNEDKKSLKKELFETIEEDCEGSYWKAGLSRFLLLTNWKNDWEHWDTLNHEVKHLVDTEAKDRFFEEEMEFTAYLQEGIFRKLRKVLLEG